MELVGARRGQLVEMTGHDNYTYVVFSIPARGLIGLRTRLLNATQGTAVIHHRFERFAPVEGDIPERPNGVLVSMVAGRVNAYALDTLQERSELFVAPGDEVYEGMIVGENSRSDDMAVNPDQGKEAHQHAGHAAPTRTSCSSRRGSCRWKWRSNTSRKTSWSKSRPHRSASAKESSRKPTAAAWHGEVRNHPSSGSICHKKHKNARKTIGDWSNRDADVPHCKDFVFLCLFVFFVAVRECPSWQFAREQFSIALALFVASAAHLPVDHCSRLWGFEWQSSDPESQGISRQELDSLQTSLADKNTKALLIICNDRIVWEWYAPGHSQTKTHYSASMAKALVGGVALAVAISDDRIALDDRVSKFVPQWRNDPHKATITIRHLGSHTSGLADAEDGDRPHEQLTGWQGDFWKRLPPPRDPFTIARDLTPVLFDPGSSRQYSNPGDWNVELCDHCRAARCARKRPSHAAAGANYAANWRARQ